MNVKFFWWNVGISVVTSSIIAGALIFWNEYQHEENFEDSWRTKAKLVVENEVLLSDRMHRMFTSSTPTDFISAAEQGVKSVVYVRTIHKNKAEGVQTGSGVILTSDGYLITNQHVIAEADQIEITLDDKRTFIGKVVGEDAFTDLAVLKIEAEDLPYIMMYNSDSLKVGEWVLAVGNPFKLQSTVTAGIVSAKHRNLNLLSSQGIESYIQTDAAINPGNSGGALLNTDGKLVGISSAILSNTGSYEGFSFAVPINIVRKVFSDLKNFGTVQRGWLGIDIENVDHLVAEEIGLSDIKGVRIIAINKDGSAYDASMKVNDVICSINGKSIRNTSEFMEDIASFKPGDVISAEYVRSGKKGEVKLTLKNHINTTDNISIRNDKILTKIGIEIRDMDGIEKTLFAQKGVKVVSVKWDSPAGKSKLEPNYIITKMNNKTIQSADQCIKEFESLGGRVVILEGFYQDYPGEFPYTFRVPQL
ncbi:MAG: trypsin-like peptidase domain-containing protein [Saprospiraceae bacterium]